MNKKEEYLKFKLNFEKDYVIAKAALEGSTQAIQMMHDSNYKVKDDAFDKFIEHFYIVIGATCKFYNKGMDYLVGLIKEEPVGYIDSETKSAITFIENEFTKVQALCEERLQNLRKLVAKFSQDFKLENRPVHNTYESQKIFLDEYLKRIHEIDVEENNIEDLVYQLESLIDKKKECEGYNSNFKVINNEDLGPENL